MKTILSAIYDYFEYKDAIESLSKKTIHNRKYELNRFNQFCNEKNIEFVDQLDKKIIISYMHSLDIKKASKLHILYVLTGFMDYLVDEDLIIENYASIIDKPKCYMPKADYLNFDELETLFRSEAKNAPKKVVDRNLLLFALFTDLCLRVSEVVNLRHEDVRIDTREIWVTRKRGKTDRMPLHEGLISQFETWLFVRSMYKGNHLPWIFLSSHGKQLTPRQVHYIVSQALKRAGIYKRKKGPHLLRHSGASLKAKSGENLIMIQYLLGHENLNTTRRYLHFNWEELKELVDRSPKFT